jgi:hypothetical protein
MERQKAKGKKRKAADEKDLLPDSAAEIEPE